MSRKEKIENKAKIRADQYSHPAEWNDCYHHWIEGAEWADEHPSEELLNKAWNRVWPMLEHLGVCKESVEAEKELFFKALR